MSKDFFYKLRFLFHTNEILEILDLEKKDIIAYYRHSYTKEEDVIKAIKNLYLTEENIIIADLDDLNLNISLIPIKELRTNEVKINFKVFKDILFDRIETLQFNEIQFNNELDKIIPCPVDSEEEYIDFSSEYEHFIKSLAKLIIK